MAKKKYTIEQIEKKFKGKAIDKTPFYNKKKFRIEYEVKSASKIIKNINSKKKEDYEQ
jgi:hypothetical protein